MTLAQGLHVHLAGAGVVQRTIAAAGRELLLTLPTDKQPICPEVDVIAASRVAATGVPVRIYAAGGRRRVELLADTTIIRLMRAGATVYTTSEALPRLSVIDGNVLVFARNHHDYRDGGLIGWDLPFAGLIARSVRGAATAVLAAGPAQEKPAESLDLEVLRQLVRGAKDETAAREMGLALRTYRRMVARLMSRLGARSRFQAGYLAAQQGFSATRSG